MMSTFPVRAAIAICALLMTACASFQANPPLEKFNSSAGYRFEALDNGRDDDNLFVILAFSGGGTRAAALSYGLLEALRDTDIQLKDRKTTLLDEVDVISSASGGSFPAAYFGLYGKRIFNEFPDKFLYRPVQSDLLQTAINPVNLLRLTGSSFGRSDLAAEFYDREIFDRATYADLVAQHHRPFIILNATDMTTGTQFPFIQDQFDLLCSDLSGVTIGRAVAASSAFPVGLTPLTFENYAGKCGYEQPTWVELAAKDHFSRINAPRTARAENRLSYTDATNMPRKYIHLIDGGVADNLGLRGPLTAISSVDNSWSVLRRINLKKIDKLVVIVVNANNNPPQDRDASPDVPGLIDTIATTAEVPLGNYTFDTLELLRKTVNEFNESARMVSECKSLSAEKGRQCSLEIPAPHQIELYPIEVALEYIESPNDRNWFKNVPTSFELPKETVDKLRKVSRKILNDDPEFKRLMQALHGCLATDDQSC